MTLSNVSNLWLIITNCWKIMWFWGPLTHASNGCRVNWSSIIGCGPFDPWESVKLNLLRHALGWGDHYGMHVTCMTGLMGFWRIYYIVYIALYSHFLFLLFVIYIWVCPQCIYAQPSTDRPNAKLLSNQLTASSRWGRWGKSTSACPRTILTTVFFPISFLPSFAEF